MGAAQDQGTRPRSGVALIVMHVDYDQIASRYDNFRRGGGPYIGQLAALAADCAAEHVIEIGAGTGLNTQAFLESYACRLTALELSGGMLAQAKTKHLAAGWVRGSALHIPLASGSASFVFGVYVLHHLRDLDALFAECSRVLDKGCAAFVTASTEFIERHPMNRYFPSFAKVDKARFQPVEAIEASLLKAGFERIGIGHFVDQPRSVGPEYVEKVANKFISTYDLIPAAEFEEGVKRLRADVRQRGELDVKMVWESVAIWGWK